jgi:ureidoglycolate hydrolase
MTDPESATLLRLPVTHLERASFAPYGAVIGAEAADSPNFNRAPGNLGFLWAQHPLEFPSQPQLCTLRYYYRAARCEFVQRHPASTVVLIPMGLRASIIYVALDDGFGRPELASARAILLEGDRGVIMHRGTWLRYAYPIGPFVDFAYVTQRLDPGTANSTDDVERCSLDETFGLVLDVDFTPPPGALTGSGGAVVQGTPRNPPLE